MPADDNGGVLEDGMTALFATELLLLRHEARIIGYSSGVVGGDTGLLLKSLGGSACPAILCASRASLVVKSDCSLSG